MILPTSFNPNPNIPGHNRRLRRVFKGAVGVAHDSRILWEVTSDPNAPFLPPEKYYLCDVASAHLRGFMAPCRNVRKQGLSDDLFAQYYQPNVSLRNTHVNVGADEDDDEANGTALD
ncbi:hypothetical protein E3N88_11713 [Mikania micrantha]|uniref:Uncharacterized protein n=1 Tax=Mikania micrantha TaxID=192012 RepID=A0A5N6P3G8_9ASTR|nr:hypothetical protein E3N88_11713 [Mikania micrantha]